MRLSRRAILSELVAVGLTLLVAAPLLFGRSYYQDDVRLLGLPLASWLQHSLREGQSLVWNPGMFGGTSSFAAGQTGACYPLYQLLYRLLPLAPAFALTYLLHLWLLARGLLGLGLELGYGLLGAATVALVGACGGATAAHVIHNNVIAGMGWAGPILWLACRAARRSEARREVLLLGAAFGLALTCAHPQYVWFAGLAAMLLAPFARADGVTVRQVLGRLLGAALLGLLLAAVQVLPTLEYVHHFPRHFPDGRFAYLTTASFGLLDWLRLLAPDLAGSPARGDWDAQGFLYWETRGLCGTVFLAFAIGAARRRESGAVRGALVLAAVAALLMLGKYNPLYRLLVYVPPFSIFRAPGRCVWLLQLAVALLAGSEVGRLRSVGAAHEVAPDVGASAPSPLTPQPPSPTPGRGGVAASRSESSPLPLGGRGVGGEGGCRGPATRPGLVVAIAWLVVIIMAVATGHASALGEPQAVIAYFELLVLGVAVGRPGDTRPVLPVLLLLGALELAVSWHSYAATSTWSELVHEPPLAKLVAASPQRRLLEIGLGPTDAPAAERRRLLSNSGLLWGIQYLRGGSEALIPTGHLAVLRDTEEALDRDPALFEFYCDRYSVRWVVTSRELTGPTWRAAGHDADATLYENLDARPMVYAVPAGYVNDLGVLSDPTAEPPITPVQVDQAGPDRWRLTTDFAEPMAVVLAQSMYNGWLVYVDGRQGYVNGAERLFMAVVVPPGQHRIEFVFDNALSYLGSSLSKLGWLLWLIGLSWCLRSGRAAKGPVPDAGTAPAVVS